MQSLHNVCGGKIVVPNLFFFDVDNFPVQRPFLNDFSRFPDTTWNAYYQNHPELHMQKVTQGHPAAQDYSFGNAWLRAVSANLTYVVGPNSPVHHVTDDEAKYLYAAGPPYWMTTRDAYRISYHWSDFLPRIFQLKPVFMAEVSGILIRPTNRFFSFNDKISNSSSLVSRVDVWLLYGCVSLSFSYRFGPLAFFFQSSKLPGSFSQSILAHTWG
jgi:hypothetical protein